MKVNIQELPHRIIESRFVENIRHNPIAYGALAVALIGLGITEAPFSHGFFSGLDHIASGLLAIPTWDLPTKSGLTEMIRDPEGLRQLGRWLALDGGLTAVGALAEKGVRAANKLMNVKKEENMRDGIEPLSPKENPSHVFIGPSGLISDLTSVMEGNKTSGKKRPIVGIHLDQGVPPVWGQEMKYHFRLFDPEELTRRFPPSTKKMTYIEATGLDRAEEITFACINPDNALFYGSEAQSGIPPTFVSTLIRSMSPEKLKDKKINVIYNEETELGGTSSIAKELEGLAKELGFTLNLITPEELFMDKLKEDLIKISESKKYDQLIEITLVGQGKTENDQKMLFNFKAAIEKIKDEKIQNKIIVSLLQKRRLDNFTLDENGTKISKEEMRIEVNKVLNKSDYVLVYGDVDHGTSTDTRLLIGDYNVPKIKVHSIAEKLGNLSDFKDVEDNVFVIYQIILDKMKQRRK